MQSAPLLVASSSLRNALHVVQFKIAAPNAVDSVTFTVRAGIPPAFHKARGRAGSPVPACAWLLAHPTSPPLLSSQSMLNVGPGAAR